MPSGYSASIFTLSQTADRLGINFWHFLRALDRGIIPQPKQGQRYRHYTLEDLPTIRAALIRAGLLAT
jgi:hypothetical protein